MASLEETIRAADAAGVSYGKYVQQTEEWRRPAAKAKRKSTARTPRPKRPPAPPEVRAEAVRAVQSGECSIREAAEKVGYPYASVVWWLRVARGYNWREKHPPRKRVMVSEEVKAEAVRAVLAGKRKAYGVAADLGVNESTVYAWLKKEKLKEKKQAGGVEE